MYQRIPWIISRRRKIIASSIDYFITVVLYNFIFLKELGTYPYRSVYISLGLFWVIISYILGRYIKTERITLKSFGNAALKTTFVLLLCNLIYIIINWWLPLIFYWDTSNYSSYYS